MKLKPRRHRVGQARRGGGAKAHQLEAVGVLSEELEGGSAFRASNGYLAANKFQSGLFDRTTELSSVGGTVGNRVWRVCRRGAKAEGSQCMRTLPRRVNSAAELYLEISRTRSGGDKKAAENV